jgi:probable HAF family extracellular repeat protein
MHLKLWHEFCIFWIYQKIKKNKRIIKMLKNTRLILATLALSSMYTGNALAISYTITDIGSLEGATRAYAINDSGQVVGESRIHGNNHAFIYSNGTMLDIGTFGGATSIARDINNSGAVTGSAAYASGDVNAFIYSDGSLQSLGTAGTSDGSVSYRSSAGFSINSTGQVVGSSSRDFQDGTSNSSGYLFENGNVTYRSSILRAINDSGAMVGGNTLRQGDSFSTIPGFCTGLFCEPYAEDINNKGTIVGTSHTAFDGDHAFMYDGNTVTDLGALNGGASFANGINEWEQIVGRSSNSAFIYENGAMLDLNTLIDPAEGWNLQEANDINESGQIVGWGFNGFQTRAFLLTPVPVPAAVWLFASGLIGLAGFARRKKV